MAMLPTIVYQVLFMLNFANCMLTTWFLCKLIHTLPFLGSLKTRQGYCVQLCNQTFYFLMVVPCRPWIHLHGFDEFTSTLSAPDVRARTAAPFVLANHNSKLDSLLITALFPGFLAFKMRSLTKLALFSEPLFGGICTSVGHFPVFFKGSASGDFSVDKDAQKKVADDMDEFLGNGGGLLLFPEGQLNKTPRTLQSFRHGAFAMPMAQKRPIWAVLNVGCETSWPYTAALGGQPADIYVSAIKITDDASQFEDKVQLAQHAYKLMQEEIDKMYKRADQQQQRAKAN